MTYEEATIWLAGLLEGEGCFRAAVSGNNPSWRPNLRISLQMTDLDVLELAAQLTNYQVTICCDGRKNRPTEKPAYEIQWGAQQAEHLMRRVLPFMCERRTANIEECLSQELSHHERKKVA